MLHTYIGLPLKTFENLRRCVWHVGGYKLGEKLLFPFIVAFARSGLRDRVVYLRELKYETGTTRNCFFPLCFKLNELYAENYMRKSLLLLFSRINLTLEKKNCQKDVDLLLVISNQITSGVCAYIQFLPAAEVLMKIHIDYNLN